MSKYEVQHLAAINMFKFGKILKFGIPFFWKQILIRFKFPFFSIMSCGKLVCEFWIT
jgi:hypothetical protein